jgi:hypothetical protein
MAGRCWAMAWRMRWRCDSRHPRLGEVGCGIEVKTLYLRIPRRSSSSSTVRRFSGRLRRLMTWTGARRRLKMEVSHRRSRMVLGLPIMWMVRLVSFEKMISGKITH